MRKKVEKHNEPLYTKSSTDKGKGSKQKSRTQHSIISKHEQTLCEFKNKAGRLDNINKKISVMQKNITKLSKERSFKQLNSESTTQSSSTIYKLQEELLNLEKARDVIDSGEDEVEYLLDSTQLILEYMSLEQKETDLLNENVQDVDSVNRILNQKTNIVEQYMSKFEPNHIPQKPQSSREFIICEDCNAHYESAEGFLVCPVCGKCIQTLETSTDLSFKEMQTYDYRPQFTYNKKTHLEDWIRRFQAKENRSIPQEVLDKVVLEAQKERVKDLGLLTEEKVKKYLKKLDLNDYYDNVIGIINRINGRKPFTLTVEIEDKVKKMFQQIQEPFERHRPAARKNFLSYAYVLNKFFQILGLYEFSKYFPLLKSPDKLRQQDDIFKKIVVDMVQKDKSVNWTFYPSI